jgi:hypothetical protein
LKTKLQILILGFILIFGCKSKNIGIYDSNANFIKFEFITTDKPFELKLTEFQANVFACNTEGLPYAVLIGKTYSERLPKKITVLSYCDDRYFEIGEKLKIIPTDNPTKRTSLNPIYLVKDSILNGKKTSWLIGSENKTIWARPE